MIIARLKGGLGNQLFQYSFAKVLSITFNRKLLLDSSLFNYYQSLEEQTQLPSSFVREYQLHHFNISSKVINKYLLHFINRYSKNNTNTRSNLISKSLNFTIITPNNFSFEKVEQNKNIILDGYWQNQDIIDEYKNELINDLKLAQPLNSQYGDLIANINTTNSVSIHIRRGDYINNPEVKKKFVECDIDYYHRSIKYISSKITNAKYFVFSDDIQWAKTNLNNIEDIEFVDNNGVAYEHLHLMSHCKHQIIANSSFSWWAAWLNNNKDKFVIYPRYWYYDKKLNESAIRIPKNWIILNNV